MRLFGEDSNGCIHDRWVLLVNTGTLRLMPGGYNGPIEDDIWVLEACWGCGLLRVAAVEHPELTTPPLASDTKPTS